MESIIEESEDEDLLERHLNGEEITAESVTDDVRAAIATARFFPIIGTHAPSGLGVEGLYDLFERGFPSPAAAALPAVYTADGKPFGDAAPVTRRARWSPKSCGPRAPRSSAGSAWSGCSPAPCAPTRRCTCRAT